MWGGEQMKRLSKHICALAIASAVALIPAYAQSDRSADRKIANTAGGRTAQDRLVREVRHELVMLPYYGVFDNLSYKVEGATVTLMGQVTRTTLKSDAENVVKGIEGVEKVNNQIQVLPLSSMDDRIRLAVYRAIFAT